MTPAQLAAMEDDVLLADGLDDAFLGVAHRGGGPPVAVYDYAACVAVLQRDQGWDEEGAEEWMAFNVAGAYVGPQTPFFLRRAETPGAAVEP